MIAAIYARKSTEQIGRSEELKSVTRQKDLARAFAAAQGWSVEERYVFEDDGISGAEFERRPGFMRLMSSLRPRAPFQVLIVSEQKSIGREMSETGMAIKQLDEAGVKVWSYTEARCLTPRSAVEKLTSSVQSFSDEDHRIKSSQRVTESHSRSVDRGHVVGGRVFGYRNVDIMSGTDQHGRPLRSHVERVINETEAPVVLRMFELYASGFGLKAIAKALTNERAPSPKPFARRSADGVPPVAGWSPSTVRTILTRDIYRGMIVWNKSRKRNDWGKVDQRARPESEWKRVAAEHLRIIPDDLWTRVATRRQETEGKAVRFESGRLSGRPPKHATKNLLAGLATCGICGGGMIVETSGRRASRVPYYLCHRYKNLGTCSNALRVPVSLINEAVLNTVEEHALTPEAVEHVIQLTERDDVRDQQAALDREREDIGKRIKRLVDAIEIGGEALSLVAKLRELEARQGAISGELAVLQPVPRLAREVIENRLNEWRRLLRQSPTQARAVLQRLLQGRLTFTPHPSGTGYNFSGPTRFDKLFAGIAVERPAWIQGEAETFPADETFDLDYGRILERAHARLAGKVGKGVASPAGFGRLWTSEVHRRISLAE